MTPDEVRSGIAANPQTPTERARLINAAIENNMADEIPDDWGIGIGQSPEEPPEAQVHNFGEIVTDQGTIYILIYSNGLLVIENEGGNIIYEFSRETTWANNELLSLEDNLSWAGAIAQDPDLFRDSLGERPIDPTMLLHSWRTGISGPGGSPPLIVGLNDEFQATIRIQDQLYAILDDDEIDDAIKDLRRLYKLLRNDFE